jgi:hypothetical protein
MAAIALTAIGIFAIGVVIGVIAMVSHGIHREQRRFDEARRHREEQGIWDASEAPEYFLSDAPDGVSNAARRLNGLYVRHLPTVRPTVRDYDAELAA